MYIGTVRFQQHRKENIVAPIVDKDVFNAVQERLEKSKHKPAAHKAEDFICYHWKHIVDIVSQQL